MPQEQEKAGRNADGTFPKGVSGNPGGRPQGSVSIVNLVRLKLQQIPPGEKRTYAEKLVDRILSQTTRPNADTALIRDLIDRVDGRPLQSQDITSGGEPIKGFMIQFKGNDDADDPIFEETPVSV